MQLRLLRAMSRPRAGCTQDLEGEDLGARGGPEGEARARGQHLKAPNGSLKLKVPSRNVKLKVELLRAVTRPRASSTRGLEAEDLVAHDGPEGEARARGRSLNASNAGAKLEACESGNTEAEDKGL